MNYSDLFDYLRDKPNKRALIDELEAKGEISPLMAIEAHGYLDDFENDAYERMIEKQI